MVTTGPALNALYPHMRRGGEQLRASAQSLRHSVESKARDHTEVFGKFFAEQADELVAAARKLDLDDLVDLIQALPSDSGRQLLQAMDVRKRQQLMSMLSYPEDSAGGLMNTDHLSVRADVRVWPPGSPKQ